MINSRLASDLDPEAAIVHNAHIFAATRKGIELLTTSTYRDFEAQTALWNIGRVTHLERRTVTNAQAGHSWHNFRCAWDVVPLINGKAVWDERDPVWKEVIALGKTAGAEAGADWPLFKDLPHFQFRPHLDGIPIALDVALKRWQSNGTIFT